MNEKIKNELLEEKRRLESEINVQLELGNEDVAELLDRQLKDVDAKLETLINMDTFRGYL
jgi:hypothetical protein